MIRVQLEDFDVGAELARLTAGRTDVGGVAAFIGLVRDLAGGAEVGAMTLEHYPGMTERKLAEIEAEAQPPLAPAGQPHPSTAMAGSSRATASCWSPPPRRIARPRSNPAPS